MVRAFDIMESLRQCRTGITLYEENLNAVVAKNPAFVTIFDYYHILKGDQFEVATDTPEDAVAFKFFFKTTLRICFALAASWSTFVFQLDVRSAFLNANLSDEIY